MTFTDIVNSVADELNLTSTAALTRIGKNVNKTWRELCSALGLEMLARGTVSATTQVGNRYVVFPCQKLYAVLNPAYTPPTPLGKVLYDDLLNDVPGTDPPQVYADYQAAAHTFTIYLDCVPQSAYQLIGDALVSSPTLSGNMEPTLAEDFHDILEYKAKAIELRKMEKYELAQALDGNGDPEAKCLWNKRMGELRLFYYKNAYLDIHQGKTNADTTPFVPPMVL